MALTTEERKKRQTIVYPSEVLKSKSKTYAEKKGMSMSKIYIEGAKLYMKLNPLV